MTIWPPKAGTLRRPVYRSLADTLIRAVNAGELKPGDRLPTHRNLAYDLDVSVQTVSRAYDELIRHGYISGEVGRGTFVLAGRNEPRTPFTPNGPQGTVIDCSILKPVFETIHLEAARKMIAALGPDLPPEVLSSFRPSRSMSRYIGSAHGWLDRCGIPITTQGVLLTNGNTSAMTTALLTACKPGDLVVAAELTHHTLKPLAQYLGLRIQGLEIDDEGITPAAFSGMCARTPVRAVFFMPTGINPCARIMSEQRRIALVDIARKYDVQIIESDAWGPVQNDRPPSFAKLAPERTLYFTSLTKCIMAGLRVGFLVVPETLESAASIRHMVTNWVATPLMAEWAARWIADGTAEELLNWQKSALAERNRLAAEVLSGIDFYASDNGLHIWLPLTGGWTEEAFVAHARHQGVAVAPGSSFQISDHTTRIGVRICLGAESLDALGRGLSVIQRLVRSHPEPALLTI
jgi:DNA-binding transcriptional MocR family regulator